MSNKTKKWFTSPWNFAEEVRSQLKFAPKIELHDVTLRDGEQHAGVTFRKDDKVRIAELLAEAGVHRIEAGMPAVSKEDELAIKEIVKRKLRPQDLRLRPLHEGRRPAGRRLRRRWHRDGSAVKRSHHQARLQMASGKGRQSVGRGNPVRQEERPLHGLLSHRCLARRYQLVPGPDRAHRQGRPHGRAGGG